MKTTMRLLPDPSHAYLRLQNQFLALPSLKAQSRTQIRPILSPLTTDIVQFSGTQCLPRVLIDQQFTTAVQTALEQTQYQLPREQFAHGLILAATLLDTIEPGVSQQEAIEAMLTGFKATSNNLSA